MMLVLKALQIHLGSIFAGEWTGYMLSEIGLGFGDVWRS